MAVLFIVGPLLGGDVTSPEPPAIGTTRTTPDGSRVVRTDHGVTASLGRPGIDTTPPRCEVIEVVGGDLHVEVEDTGEGLKAINVLVDDNAKVSVPAVAVGTTAVVRVVGTRIDPDAPARVMIETFDNSPDTNRSECDLVSVPLSSEKRTGPVQHTFSGMPVGYRYVALHSDSPACGLVTVNHAWSTVLTDGHPIDIAPALLSGQRNTVTLWSLGVSGSVLFSNIIPSNSTGRATGEPWSSEDLCDSY